MGVTVRPDGFGNFVKNLFEFVSIDTPGNPAVIKNLRLDSTGFQLRDAANAAFATLKGVTNAPVSDADTDQFATLRFLGSQSGTVGLSYINGVAVAPSAPLPIPAGALITDCYLQESVQAPATCTLEVKAGTVTIVPTTALDPHAAVGVQTKAIAAKVGGAGGPASLVLAGPYAGTGSGTVYVSWVVARE
jgi:hypothetical protein